MHKIFVASQTFESEPPAVALIERSGVPYVLTPIETRKHWSEDDYIAALQGASALIAGGDFKITKRLIDACPDLRAVSLNCTGTDHVDVAALEARGIPLMTTPGLSHTACADFIIGQTIALMRNIAAGDRAIRRGDWVAGVERGLAVSGKTMGIIGLGSIGLDVCDRARGFGIRVLAHVRHPKPELAAAHGFEYVERDELLKQSDILVICCPLTDQTRGSIGARELSLLPNSAVLINSARGPIVDEHALYDALTTGRLRGAALDVFDTEPLRESRLFSLDNVLLTPHLAGRADAQIEACAVKAAQNLLDWMRG